MSRRSGILEFAVLGLLRESPMHGYELRKRLNTSLGVFRAFSYGTPLPLPQDAGRQRLVDRGAGQRRRRTPLAAPHSPGAAPRSSTG